MHDLEIGKRQEIKKNINIRSKSGKNREPRIIYIKFITSYEFCCVKWVDYYTLSNKKVMKNVNRFDQPAMLLVARAETKTEGNVCFLFDGGLLFVIGDAISDKVFFANDM
jgi:hypothetical protein